MVGRQQLGFGASTEAKTIIGQDLLASLWYGQLCAGHFHYRFPPCPAGVTRCGWNDALAVPGVVYIHVKAVGQARIPRGRGTGRGRRIGRLQSAVAREDLET